MTSPDLIPTLDPSPLPAPYWVFKLLLIVTFFLHIVAMNFMLGGALLALAVKRRAGNQDHNRAMALDLAKKLPLLLPATITVGIAPLLFVQVLYGQFFYTSSIIMAWTWFLVLALLTAAYYGFYYVSYQGGRRQGAAGVVLWLGVLFVLLIGFIYSNNLTLMQTPSGWAAKYFASAAGWHLNLAEPTLFARFLHFITAAVAVGGLLLVWIAYVNRRRDADYARAAFRYGGRAFMYATMAQVIVGLWFLAVLPRDLRMMFMGDSGAATLLLLVGVAAAIGAIVIVAEAVRRDDIGRAAWYGSILTGVAILCMAIMRDLLRDAYLRPYFHAGQFEVKTQWSVFPLFLVLFIGGVVLLAWMLRRYSLLVGAKALPAAGAVAPGEGRPS